MSAAAQPNKAGNSAGNSAGILQCESEAAGQVAGHELKVIICQGHMSFWEFEGTRAQLEAEGVIPPDVEWPTGADRCSWETGRFVWWLRRRRPEGLKGPMRLWTSGDWWYLRCSDRGGLGFTASAVHEAERKLQETIHRHSPAGQLERAIAWSRFSAASQDKDFQAFKRSLYGVDSKKRRAGGAGHGRR